MKEQLKTIVKHFGINNQQRKLQEEIFELQEAITIYEYSDNKDKEHIIEELADVMVLINQISLHYGIYHDDVLKVAKEKAQRTIERIDSGYYESNDR